MENVTRADLVTTQEAADTLGIPVPTLAHWRRAGKAPRSVKVGRERLWVRTEVEGFYARELREQNDVARSA